MTVKSLSHLGHVSMALKRAVLGMYVINILGVMIIWLGVDDWSVVHSVRTHPTNCLHFVVVVGIRGSRSRSRSSSSQSIYHIMTIE